MLSTANLNLTTFTVVAVVANLATLAGQGHIIGEYNTTGNQRKWRIIRDATPTNVSLNISADGTSGTVVSAAAAIPSAAGPHIVTATFNGSTARIRVNGGAWQTAAATMYATTSPRLTIGSRDGGGDPLGGDVAQAFICSSVLSDADLSRAERDARRKWAVAA